MSTYVCAHVCVCWCAPEHAGVCMCVCMHMYSMCVHACVGTLSNLFYNDCDIRNGVYKGVGGWEGAGVGGKPKVDYTFH